MVPAWDITHAFKKKGSESTWNHLLRCYRELGVPKAERELS